MRTLLLALVMVGCGSIEQPAERTHAKVYKVPYELQEYVDTFLYEARDRGRDIQIDDLVMEFGELDNPRHAAVCIHSATPKIIMSSAHWEQFSEPLRTLTVAHELGHCILGKGHTTGIMAEILPRTHEIEKSSVQWWDDLFNYND